MKLNFTPSLAAGLDADPPAKADFQAWLLQAQTAINALHQTMNSPLSLPGLTRLKTDMSNPLCQFLGIVLIGDSITWGKTLPDNATSEPHTGKLTDPRNNGSSASWANLLHKYLGRSFYNDGTADEFRWSGSPSGVSTFVYNQRVDVFPTGDAFTFDYESTSTSPDSGWLKKSGPGEGGLLAATLTGSSYLDTTRMAMRFRMTGNEFSLMYAALADGAKYEVFVNGISRGIATTNSSDLGIAPGYGYERVHNLGAHYRDAEITIAVVNGDASRYKFRVEAIRMNRKLRVTNQGVVGSAAWIYNPINIPDATVAGDYYAIIQFGTNDRSAESTTAYVQGAQGFEAELEKMVQTLLGKSVQPIMAVPPAASTDIAPPQFFTIADAHAAILRVARRFSLDMIDHYTPTRLLLDAGDSSWLADGLHPNAAGHQAMFGRIRDRIDAAR